MGSFSHWFFVESGTSGTSSSLGPRSTSLGCKSQDLFFPPRLERSAANRKASGQQPVGITPCGPVATRRGWFFLGSSRMGNHRETPHVGWEAKFNPEAHDGGWHVGNVLTCGGPHGWCSLLPLCMYVIYNIRICRLTSRFQIPHYCHYCDYHYCYHDHQAHHSLSFLVLFVCYMLRALVKFDPTMAVP